MSSEMVVTIFIPALALSGCWLAIRLFTKAKQRLKRHRIERGVADYLHNAVRGM